MQSQKPNKSPRSTPRPISCKVLPPPPFPFPPSSIPKSRSHMHFERKPLTTPVSALNGMAVRLETGRGMYLAVTGGEFRHSVQHDVGPLLMVQPPDKA